jgi:hypothetical protein
MVVNYNYHWLYGFFEAKVLINEGNLDNIKSKLLKFFTEETHRKYSLSNRPQWWDLNDRYLAAYYKVEAGPKFLIFSIITTSNLAIISKQDDGKYYLYLDFVTLPRDVIVNSFKRKVHF